MMQRVAKSLLASRRPTVPGTAALRAAALAAGVTLLISGCAGQAEGGGAGPSAQPTRG